MNNVYTEYEDYMKLSCNHLDNVIDTKRALYTVLSNFIENNRYGCIAVGGLRRVGKTTVLKQLAQKFDKALYISFAQLRSLEQQECLLSVLKEKVKNHEIIALLLDEVTKLYYYDDVIPELLELTQAYKASLIITSSSMHYLRVLTKRTCGSRCTYLELPQISYYEYLYFKRDKDIVKRRYFVKYSSREEDMREFLEKTQNLNPGKETFSGYVNYCASNNFANNLHDYISGCYEDFILSERAYAISTLDIPEDFDMTIVTKLLCVSQYTLMQQFNKKKSLIESTVEYRKERQQLKKEVGYQNFAEIISKAETTLQQYVRDLNKATREEISLALSILVCCGLVFIHRDVQSTNDVKYIKEDMRYLKNGNFYDTMDKMITYPMYAADINIYILILKELLFEIGLDSSDVAKYIENPLFGLFIEFYVTSQVSVLNKTGYVLKLVLPDYFEYASEIDVVSKEVGALIEVGVGSRGKSFDMLAFNDPAFEGLYSEFKDYDKLFISANDLHKHKNFLEVPYWLFIMLVDANSISQYVRSLGYTENT